MVELAKLFGAVELGETTERLISGTLSNQEESVHREPKHGDDVRQGQGDACHRKLENFWMPGQGGPKGWSERERCVGGTGGDCQ